MSDENLLEMTPSQTEEELELEPIEPEGGLEDQGDPLDKIEDVAELRAKAKQYRSSFQRAKKSKTEQLAPKSEEPVKPSSDGFMRKSDFELANQKKAIKMATIISDTDSDEVKKMKADILENFDHVKQFYTPRRGKDTPEDIFEDIRDAHLLSQSRRTPTKPKPDTTAIVATQTFGTGEAPVKDKQKDPPGFKMPTPPSEWYKKKA